MLSIKKIIKYILGELIIFTQVRYEIIKFSGDLLVLDISTEKGLMIGCLKVDFKDNIEHNAIMIKDKVGVNLNKKRDRLPN